MMRPPATKPPAFMQFLVGTQGALGLVTVRGREVLPLEVHTRAGLYYGVTWDFERYYIVARGAPTNLLAATKGPEGLAVFEDMPAPITTVYDQGIPSPHQAHYNGRLWITDTQSCALLNYDPATKLWGNPVTWGGNRDRHLNSVWGSGADLWIVEHTRENPYKFIRRLTPGAVSTTPELSMTLALDLPELNQGRLQAGIHNVYREKERIYSLGPVHIIISDLVTGKVEAQALEEVQPKAHYLRGLARVWDGWEDPEKNGTDYFIIGRSNSQPRGDRGHGSSAILCYSREWRLLAVWDLPEAWGQVMEIRALTHTDKAHNGITPPHMRRGQRWGFRTWEPTNRQ